MKRLFSLLIIICMVSCSLVLFVACKDKPQLSEQPPVYYTVSYNIGTNNCTLPPDSTVQGGVAVSALSFPSDFSVAEGFEPCWYTDSALTTPLDLSMPINSDLVLYLGTKACVYSISYTYDNSLTFSGDFVSAYTYGTVQPLPQCTMGKGYQKYGKWVFGEGEQDYFSTAVSADHHGDLQLRFVPDPVIYTISYSSGINSESTAQMVNTNPIRYDITMGTVTLLPAQLEGKTFSHWMYVTSGIDELNKRTVSELSFDFVYGRQVMLWAVWE